MTNHLKKPSFIVPPRVAEGLLYLILSGQDSDSVVGDFAEIFFQQIKEKGVLRARLWYWLEIVRSGPELLSWKLTLQLERMFQMTIHQSYNKFAVWLGAVALLPALFLVIPGVLQSVFGLLGPNQAVDVFFTRMPLLQRLFSPFVVLGGLLLAFVLNLVPSLSMRLERQPETLTGIITFRRVIANWGLVVISLILLFMILAYAFFENFAPV